MSLSRYRWDILATEPHSTNGVKLNGLMFATLTVKESKADILVYTDSDEMGSPLGIVYTRKSIYTDFPEGMWKFYLQFDGEHMVCMLPTEY